MVKLYLDIPNNYTEPWYSDHVEVRTAFRGIIDASMRNGIELVLNKAQSYLNNKAERTVQSNGVYYAYHARVSDEHCYCIKGAALPNLWYFDSDGYSGWCSLAKDRALQEAAAAFSLPQADKSIETYRDKFFREGFSRQKQPTTEFDAGREGLSDFVFYPLQMTSDEVMKLGQFGQVEIIQRLAEIVSQFDRDIVLKRHPLCTSEAMGRLLGELKNHPRIHVSDASIHRLIPACSAVLVFNSGVGLQALIHGKPVFSMAASEYRHMTTCIEILDDLGHVFRPTPEFQNERIRQQIGHLLNEYLVDITDRAAIERRLANHIEHYVEQSGSERPDYPVTATPLSILHRAQKDLSETIDALLLDYPRLDGARKEHGSKVLLRAARNGFETAKILRLTDVDFWKRLVYLLINDGNLKLAEKLARQINAKSPEACDGNLLLSKVLYRNNKEKEALVAARRAVASQDRNADSYVFLGRKLATMGKSASLEALQMARKALELDAKDPTANWLLARLLFAEGDVDAAFGASSLAVGLRSEDPKILKLHEKIVASRDKPLPVCRDDEAGGNARRP